MNKIVRKFIAFTVSIIVGINVLVLNAKADTIKGVDISNHNIYLNLKNAANQGYRICYIKATEGKSYVNPTMDYQYREAKKAGMKIGFYHFANNNSAPEIQADFFNKVISKYSQDLQPCLDLEVPVTNATNFTQRFADYYGGKNKIVVYTGLYYYKENIWTKGFKMWIAAYGQRRPNISDNLMVGWQYSDRGINGQTDVSEWYGDIYIKDKDRVDVAAVQTINNKPKVTVSNKKKDFTYKNNCKVLGDDLYIRDAYGNRLPGRYVANGDNITVLDISYSKQLVKVEYPTLNGVKTGYVKNVPNLMHYYYSNQYRNGSTKETVYLDSNCNSKFGSLNSYESATPLYKVGNKLCVAYSTKKGNNSKNGFVKYQDHFNKF